MTEQEKREAEIAQEEYRTVRIEGKYVVAKFKERLTDLLYHPPRSTYVSLSGRTNESIDYWKIDYWKWVEQIMALIKEALPELAEEAGYVRDETLE